MKVLFVTKKEKILYEDGKILRTEDMVDGVEIRFVKRIRPYFICPPEGIPYSFSSFGAHYVNPRYTTDELADKLQGHSFIVYVDHYKKKIELFIDNGEIDQLYYYIFDFLKYFFAFFSKGIILENLDFQEKT